MNATPKKRQHLHIGEQAATATDLYQITMMYAYFAADMRGEATFEYFVRKLPRKRQFLVFAGLEQALAYLRDLRFTGEQLDYLRSLPTFAQAGDSAKRDAFFEYLRDFRFEGTVRAAPEGTIFFPNEPVLQVQGDLLGCQLVETYLLSVLNYQTLVASKAARVRQVAGESALMDFGTRRAHSPGAGIAAARAAYVGGFQGTSNVLAGQITGIPVVGTAAHAYTMAFSSEEAAFAHYLDTYPESTTLLIDTYNTHRGAERAAKLGSAVKGVRLDSGDLGQLAKDVRKILDTAGLEEAKIVASNDLNEYKIQTLLKEGAPIDVFGVGTELVTSRDDPTLSGVYKLVSRVVDGRDVPAMKLSSSKPSYPGGKDLYRAYNRRGEICAGILTQRGESPSSLGGATRIEPMLETVFADEKPTFAPPTLDEIRQKTLAGIETLPSSRRTIHNDTAEDLPLIISSGTLKKMAECKARFEGSG